MNPYRLLQKGSRWIIYNIQKQIAIAEFYDHDFAMSLCQTMNIVAKVN